MSTSCSHGPRLAVGALAVAAFLTAGSVAVPAAGQQCRGTKQWFEGACHYPDEIAKLKAARDKEAAAARQHAELERRKAEEARRKAEEERLKAEWEADQPPEPPTSDPSPDEPVAEAVPAPDAAGTPARPPAPPAKPDQTETEGISPLAYVGFAVAGVGVLVGGITGGLSLSQAAELEDRCPDDVCAPDAEGDVDTMMALGHVSTVSFVLAGAGAAVGLYGLFASGPEPETGTTRVIQPILSPGFTGVRGTF